MKEDILKLINDLVRDFVFYDRKQDEELTEDQLRQAFKDRIITVDECVEQFREKLSDANITESDDTHKDIIEAAHGTDRQYKEMQDAADAESTVEFKSSFLAQNIPADCVPLPKSNYTHKDGGIRSSCYVDVDGLTKIYYTHKDNLPDAADLISKPIGFMCCQNQDLKESHETLTVGETRIIDEVYRECANCGVRFHLKRRDA